MRLLARSTTLVLALAALAACGPKPKPLPDGGEEDAGVDAGVDAGRPAGQMPPAGYSRAIAQADGGAATTRVGVSLSMAYDQNDQPMLAYVLEDPNGDGVRQDDKVVFTRWNGVDQEWQPARTVDVCGQLDDAPPHRQVSLARDAVTGKLGIAFATAASTVKLATSDDEGESWTLEVASAPNPDLFALGDPQLAMAGGAVHLAYWQASQRCAGIGCTAVIYRTRTGSGPGGFSADAQTPLLAGADWDAPAPLSLALDSANEPALAYFVQTVATSTVAVAFWRPGSPSATAVFDSGTTGDSTPSVSLAFEGDKPRLAYHLNGADPVAQLRYSAATDAAGTSWGTPVPIPRNGAIATPETTRYFQSLALGPSGKVAIAAAFTAATQLPQQCGGPKLARSNDGSSFTVCSPDGGRVFGFAGTYANLVFDKSGKLALAFLYETSTNPSMGPGVVMWREP